MGFKQKYANKKLAKLVSAQNRKPVIPAMNPHSKVVVIWQPSEKPVVQFLREHFNKTGAIFRDYCIFDSNSNPGSETNSFFSSDLNWWGIPKPEKVRDFIETDFDLLLCIARESNFYLEYILALSKAKFKIGSSLNEANPFDLNIKIEENRDTMYLAKQQIFYLAQLNKTAN